MGRIPASQRARRDLVPHRPCASPVAPARVSGHAGSMGSGLAFSEAEGRSPWEWAGTMGTSPFSTR